MNSEIMAYGKDRKLQLVVEAKNKATSSSEWAARYRENLLSLSALPRTPYFLIATPSHFYLWVNADSASEKAQPNWISPSPDLIRNYLTNAESSPETISNFGWEFIVRAWLGDLINTHPTLPLLPKDQQWIIDSGLHKAIENGSLLTQIAA
jgi:hypothetical protein